MSASSFLIPGPAGALEVHFTAGTNRCAFVMCHPHPLHGGSMQNKVVTTLAKSFIELGYPSLSFNFRGIGQSQGVFDAGHGEQADTHAVLHWLKTEQGIDHVILAGFSFGAFIALAVSGTCSLEHLLLIAPPVEYPEFAHLHAPAPWSLIVAGADEVIHTEAILAWQKTQITPQHFLNVEQASHFFHGQLHTLKNFIHDHFQPSA